MSADNAPAPTCEHGMTAWHYLGEESGRAIHPLRVCPGPVTPVQPEPRDENTRETFEDFLQRTRGPEYRRVVMVALDVMDARAELYRESIRATQSNSAAVTDASRNDEPERSPKNGAVDGDADFEAWFRANLGELWTVGSEERCKRAWKAARLKPDLSRDREQIAKALEDSATE